jgi:hypothetical protein
MRFSDLFGRRQQVPPVKPDHVRFYHGAKGEHPASGGGRWVTTDPRYARDFRSSGQPNSVYYVDVPKGHPAEEAARMWDETDEREQQRSGGKYTGMIGRYSATEMPHDVVRKMKPFPMDDA